MYWLGIDVETTGLDPKVDRVTEIGAVLWDVKERKPVSMLNHLIWDTENEFHINEEIETITGLNDETCKKFGVEPAYALTALNELMEQASYAVAHNAPFDKGFYEAEAKRHSVGECILPWVDTLTDVDLRTSGSRSLSYLAADHGFLNPFSHRALFDVLTMFKVMSEYDPQQIMDWQASPTITLVTKLSFQDKDKAKNLSYKWTPEDKSWRKKIKEFSLDEEINLAKKAGFDLEILK